jgi:putative ABC transport system permease protein
MSMFRQIVAVCAIAFSTLIERRRTSVVIVTSVGCVVAVLVSMLSLNAGLTRMFLSASNANGAIVLARGSPHEGGSGLSRDAVGTILNAPGIAKAPDGSPLADAELQMTIMPPPGFVQESLLVRGIGANGTAIRGNFRIESGRMLRSGAQELVIGAGAARMFKMKVGDNVIMPGGYWPIVGVFSNAGDRVESELFADADTLLAASRRPGFGSVIVKLSGPGAFDEFQRWLVANPALTVEPERLPDYLLRTQGGQMQFFARVTLVISAIMAIGAVFGAIKIMFAAVRSRTREIGTLRALGFGSVPVATSVILELTVLALAGAALGVLIAWLVFDGREVYSSGVFRLHVSAPLIALGLAWGAAIALLAAAFPAIRAAKIPAAQALRVV